MSAEKTPHAYIEEARQEVHKYAQALLRENDKLRTELNRLRVQLEEIEHGREHFAEEYQRIEQQSGNLSNLYVASYQLHSSVERRAVLQTIQEIVVNLIGSEEIVVFEIDSTGRFEVASSMGIEDWSFAPFRLGEGPIGRHLVDGEIFVNPLPPDGHDRLTACIPLKVEGSIIGAIAVFRLLAHKSELERLDHELFELLAVHAATALYCATLHEKSVAREAVAS